MKGDTYIFRIDRFTPATLPMARLADYLAELAALLGSTERVHFKALKKGSAQIVSAVEVEAAPKVRARLQQVDSGDQDVDAWQHFKKIDDLLAKDNAVGSLKRDTAVILRFPGRERPRSPRIGPIAQPTELVGQLIRVGGRDQSAHALIQNFEGEVQKVTLTRAQARELAGMLYGPILRLTGPGRWLRDEDGRWELLEMRLQAFEALGDSSLRESVDALRAIEGSGWPAEEDPHALLVRIRHGDDEVH